MHRTNIDVTILGIAFTFFFVLGLALSLLGIAWPSMQAEFNLPLDGAGLLLTIISIGYILSSFANGHFINLIGVRATLITSIVIAAIGIFIQSASRQWWGVLGAGFLVGIGLGGGDTGFNSFVAPHFRTGILNWMHGCYGIGATLGPLMLTWILEHGYSWRWGYLGVAIADICVVLWLVFSNKNWREFITNHRSENPTPETPSPSIASTLRLSIVWIYIWIFFLISGIEASAGQWSFTLFTQARAVPIGIAGIWVSAYWLSFTIGRMLMGFSIDRIGALKVVRLGILVSILGAAIFWWNPSNEMGFFGLLLLGFGLAPLFPSLVSYTPRTVGKAHSANAIGFQIGASSLGLGLIPGLAGVLAKNLNINVIGPYLLVLAISVLILHEPGVYKH